MSAPHPRSFARALGDFASGADNPRDFLERCIAEIEEREPEVKAFTAMSLEAARAAADASSQRWLEGAPISAIDGMPIGVKDVIETADMPTRMGSELFEDYSPGHDSASVHALREAGAVIVGKTVTTEFAATRPGPTRNPYDLTRTPGGSSSGSAAAVGSGMLSGALGTQVVGSILRPASYCGCVGYKPSLGGINRGGSHDYMSQSCQGVIAATLEDAWQVAREIVVRAGGDPGMPGISGPPIMPDVKVPATLAFLETSGWDVATPAARDAMMRTLDALRAAGIRIITREDDTAVEALESVIPEILPLTRKINAWESRWPLNTYADRDASKLSQNMIDRLHEAEAMDIEDYRAAIKRRDEIRATHARVVESAEACITLSAPDAAPVGIEATGNPVFVVPSSLLGVPALSLPLLRVGQMPLGVQMLGYRDADAELFSISAAVVDIVAPANSNVA